MIWASTCGAQAVAKFGLEKESHGSLLAVERPTHFKGL